MSHVPLRAEKNCLNCGAVVEGRYCEVCGQENKETKETVWQIAAYFFEDLTHFDGKFFTSLKYLILKPGFLAEQYIKGKRIKYLNPIRMYLFVSAVFLLVLLNFLVVPAAKYNAAKAIARDSIERRYNGSPDNNNRRFEIHWAQLHVPGAHYYWYIILPSRYVYQTVESYDFTQKTLPGNEKDSWFTRYLTRRVITAANLYHKNPDSFMDKLGIRFEHTFSQLFFISLPLFALLLQLLYLRRKDYYYAGHFVFSIHFYCFIFLVILLCVIYGKIDDIRSFPVLILILCIFAYLYFAMLRFYKQGRLKTLMKYLLLVVSFLLITITVIAVFLFNSFMGVAQV